MLRPFSPPWVTVITSCRDLAAFRASSEEQAAAGAIELRLDRGAPDLDAEARTRIRHPVIVTDRPGEGDEDARRSTLEPWCRGEKGRCWVDLDARDPLLDELAAMTDRSRVGLIFSLHLTHAIPDREARRLLERLRRWHGAKPAAVKLVLAAGGLESWLQARRLAAQRHPLPVAIAAGGRLEGASRLLTLGCGSAWSYGRVRGSAGSDPGQPATASLATRYRTGPEFASPIRYAVLGGDTRRSLSPAYHNALLRSRCDERVFVDLSMARPDRRLLAPDGLELRGLAVTSPHKRWARAIAPPGPGEREECPSWNTLRKRPDGEWEGHNTDVPALVGLLEETGGATGPVLILGGGGVAVPLALALRNRGREVRLGVRRPSVRERLQRAHRLPADLAPRFDAARCVVNATGFDFDPQDEHSPPDWRWDEFRGDVAVEMTYEPGRPGFFPRLPAGVRRIGGAEFFGEQARRQAAILYGEPVTREESSRLVEEALRLLEEDIPADGDGPEGG